MLNGDMILKSDDIREICACAAPSMGVTPSTHPQDFGVVTVDGTVVTGLVEKSETPPGNLINAGVYLFDPEIFEKLSLLELSERGELELTDALSDYINSRSLNAFSLSSWMDVGEPWDILDANKSMLSNLEPDIKGEIKDFVTISLAEGVRSDLMHISGLQPQLVITATSVIVLRLKIQLFFPEQKYRTSIISVTV